MKINFTELYLKVLESLAPRVIQAFKLVAMTHGKEKQ
jgi:hypothetical protein